jgi:hypothetical protein
MATARQLSRPAAELAQALRAGALTALLPTQEVLSKDLVTLQQQPQNQRLATM